MILMNVSDENVDTYHLPQALVIPANQGRITEVLFPSLF